MDQLPFGKREPRVRPCPPPSEHKVFDPVIFHTPINSQVTAPRPTQYGNWHQPSLKTSAKGVDGRLTQLDRNRDNLFFVPYQKPLTPIKPPPEPFMPDRHTHTPYSYSTTWITHPDKNTSLVPKENETFKTSFLVTPNADMDRITRLNHTASKYNSINANEEHFKKYIESIDDTKASKHELNMKDIRQQRKEHLEALEKRHKLEHVHYYD